MNNKYYACDHPAARNYDAWCPICYQLKLEQIEHDKYIMWLSSLDHDQQKKQFECEHGIDFACDCYAMSKWNKDE